MLIMNIEEKREDFLKSYFDSFKQIFPELTEEEFLSYYDEIYELGLLGYPQKQGGSMWASELQNLYVLIRLLKPKNILELGNFIGVSSNAILAAVKKNKFGEVTLVDIEERLQYENLCSKNFIRILSDSQSYLNNKINFDLIIQDDDHSYENVSKELDLIKQNNINKNYLIWAHDYFVDCSKSTCKVREVYDDRKDEFNIFLPQKDSISDCGLIIVKFK